MATTPLARLDERLLKGEAIFFDGVCVLCNGLVEFVMKRDKLRRYRYATLQSEPGQQVLNMLDLPADDLTTFVLIERGEGYTKSTAALRIARKLPGLWPLLYIFILVPKPLRDAVYQWVGEHRYRWFGRRSVCRVATGDERDLFLE